MNIKHTSPSPLFAWFFAFVSLILLLTFANGLVLIKNTLPQHQNFWQSQTKPVEATKVTETSSKKDWSLKEVRPVFEKLWLLKDDLQLQSFWTQALFQTPLQYFSVNVFNLDNPSSSGYQFLQNQIVAIETQSSIQAVSKVLELLVKSEKIINLQTLHFQDARLLMELEVPTFLPQKTSTPLPTLARAIQEYTLNQDNRLDFTEVFKTDRVKKQAKPQPAVVHTPKPTACPLPALQGIFSMIENGEKKFWAFLEGESYQVLDQYQCYTVTSITKRQVILDWQAGGQKINLCLDNLC